MTPGNGRRQLVICGLGGQGIVFLSRVVASAAVLDGEAVLTAETHGMAQRGGAVEAHLKLGGFSSSLVRPGSADTALALDGTRVGVARAYLGPDGALFADAEEGVAGGRGVDASSEARAMDFDRGRNLILLGFATAVDGARFPTEESVLAALDRLSPPQAQEVNRRAFRRGRDLA